MEENRKSDTSSRSNDPGTLLQPRPTTVQCRVRGRVFVTVGSSPEARFEELVQTVTTPECLLVLKKRGFTSLVIQQGNGRFLSSKSNASDYFQIEHFGSRPNIKELINDHIHAASLVISHAGAESIFQTLRAQRPLVVVLNKQLLGEYGLELAKQLAKFMYCCSPETLVETLSVMDLEPLLPYPPHPPPFNVVADLINSLSNFLSDNEALAPFQDGANAAVPTPESDIAVPKPEISEEPTSGLRKSPTMRKAQNPEGRT